MAGIVDLLIVDNNLVLDEHGIPQLVSGVEVVAQDLNHRLQDAGLIFALLGERNRAAISQIENRIKLECEKDERVKPGTATVLFAMGSNSIGAINIRVETLIGDVQIDIPLSNEMGVS